ncbi:SseB family protein [Salana multivorans]
MPLADFLPKTGSERGKELPPVSPFAGDDGTCPPELAAALALDGTERLRAVVAALASVRVLVPVVAHEESEHDADVRERITGHRERRRPAGLVVIDDDGADDAATGEVVAGEAAEGEAAAGKEPSADGASCHDGERRASASMVTVRTPDGREALPVFSSVAAHAVAPRCPTDSAHGGSCRDGRGRRGRRRAGARPCVRGAGPGAAARGVGPRTRRGVGAGGR